MTQVFEDKTANQVRRVIWKFNFEFLIFNFRNIEFMTKIFDNIIRQKYYLNRLYHSVTKFYYLANLKLITYIPFIIAMPLFLVSCGESNKKPNKNDESNFIDNISQTTPIVHVYLENSGSMDGFVNKGNEFTTFISSYLTDIFLNFSDKINLYYINSNIIPLGSDIKDFNTKLDSEAFKRMGGNRGVTDIHRLVDTILKLTEENHVSIFVTDGIFSPGKSKDAKKYIEDQYNGIKASMFNYLKNYHNAAIVIYQLISEFKGTYYDRIDKPHYNINTRLPFYVWIFGSSENLIQLMSKIPETKFRGSKLNNLFSITESKTVNYSVVNGSGNFELSKSNPKTEICNLKREKRSRKVTFAVDANLSKLLLNEKYLLDLNNYKNNSFYQFAIQKAPYNLHGYTHRFVFTSDRVHKGSVDLMLKRTFPSWIEEVNNDEGSGPIEGKTYGIKYQLKAIHDAFTTKTETTDEYHKIISIKIN